MNLKLLVVAGVGYAIYSMTQQSRAVYRLILAGVDASTGGVIGTGATYPGCRPPQPGEDVASVIAPCDPQAFNTMDEAIAYARSRGEIPVAVNTEDEAWAIATGQIPVPEDNIL